MLVHAGYHSKAFATGVHKNFFPFFGYFFQGLEAVAHKSRAGNQQVFDAFGGHFFQTLIGKGLQPALYQPRLKGDTVFFGRNLQRFYQQLGGY